MGAESGSAVPEHLQNNEFAARTSWEPLRPKDGVNYRTRFSNRQSKHLLTFEATRTSKVVVVCVLVFSVICLVIGTLITYLWLSGVGAKGEGDAGVLKFAGPGFLAGAIFFGGLGFYLKWKLLQPIVFDLRIGRYWRGASTPDDDRSVALADVHALQVIEKWVKQTGPNSGGYSSFELNLVMTDGKRHNIVDHGDPEALRADAEELGNHLQKPIWDAAAD